MRALLFSTLVTVQLAAGSGCIFGQVCVCCSNLTFIYVYIHMDATHTHMKTFT